MKETQYPTNLKDALGVGRREVLRNHDAHLSSFAFALWDDYE